MLYIPIIAGYMSVHSVAVCALYWSMTPALFTRALVK